MKLLYLFLICCSLQSFASTEDSLSVEESYSEEAMYEAFMQYADSIVSGLKYETGLVLLSNGKASIQVPEGFKYLNGSDADMVLTDLWGNPPQDEEGKSLGMLLPEETNPISDSTYAVNITYSDEGHIKDEDASDIDYDGLLESMQEDMELANEYRVAEGYPSIDLVGWASAPYYDQEEKKLHWAKELKFEQSVENTLNYNIRVLGRTGYLQLNVIGEMFVLDEVKENIPNILPSVNFLDGHRYEDFDSNLDKVAAYGIGGLIAGKVLAKAGILAKLGILLAKGWKFILIGLIAFGGVFKRFIGKKDTDDTTGYPSAE